MQKVSVFPLLFDDSFRKADKVQTIQLWKNRHTINPADITRMLQMRHFFWRKTITNRKKCCTFGFAWYCNACRWQKYIGLTHDIRVRRCALNCVCVVNTQKLPLPNLLKCFFLNSFFSMQNFLECAKISVMLSPAILQNKYIWAKEIFYIWWCTANNKRTKASDQATQTVNKSCLPMKTTVIPSADPWAHEFLFQEFIM